MGRLARFSSYASNLASHGKMAFLAPASMAILAIVRRPSTDRAAMASPWYSRAWYRAPSSPIWLMRKSTRSFPETQGFLGTPRKTTSSTMPGFTMATSATRPSPPTASTSWNWRSSAITTRRRLASAATSRGISLDRVAAEHQIARHDIAFVGQQCVLNTPLAGLEVMLDAELVDEFSTGLGHAGGGDVLGRHEVAHHDVQFVSLGQAVDAVIF